MATSPSPLNQAPNTPLGDLDVNQYSYANFIYPMDLGVATSGKDHYMVFHINESFNTQFYTATVNGAAPTDEATINVSAARDTNLGGGGGGSNGNGTNANGTLADPNGTSTSSDNGGDASQTVPTNQTRPIQRVATTIVLYMPPEITTNYAADWTPTELGMAADLANKLKGQESWSDIFKSAGASGAKHLGDWANQWTGLNLKDAASLGKRMIINNHQEVIFNGITFRQFNFNFRFTPESEAEALNVDNIIRAFKFYSAPELLNGWAGRFWIYPAEFDIQYYANGKENLFLNKISTCALTNMQVNYTASGHWSAFRGHQDIQGSPSVCTDIALQFIELELMTKRRILEGYSVVPFWWFLPFLHPVIMNLHKLFGFLTFYKPMPHYIEVWSIFATLSLIMLMGKRMWDLLPIRNSAGENIIEMPLVAGVMHSMKRFGNMVLKTFHLK